MSLRAIFDLHHNAEKRTAERKTLRLTTSHRRSGASAGAAVVHDLSTQGMLLETSDSLTVGEKLGVELPRSGLHEAEVIWSSNDFYGCRFGKPLPSAAVSAALLKALPVDQSESPLPRRLAALRQSRGWTMEELAERLGVSRQSVWYWETGKRQPKKAMLASIAKQFGVVIDELLHDGAVADSPSGALDHWKREIGQRFGVAPDKVRILVEL